MPKTPKSAENFSPLFQSRLKFILEELGMSQIEFATYVGVSPAVIGRGVKYGILPSTRVLIRMADKLNYPLLYLMGECDSIDFYKLEPPSSYHIRIKELLKEKNVNYGQVAQKMDFSKDYFYEWDRSKTLPSIYFLKQIAKYFKVSLDYLTGRTNDRN